MPPHPESQTMSLLGRSLPTWGLLALFTLPLGAGFLSDYQEARRAIDREDWRGAIEHLEQAVDQEEEAGAQVRIYGVSFETYLPYFYLGLAHYELGNYRQALWAWEVAEDQQAVLETSHSRTLRALRKKAELKTIDTVPEPSLAQDETSSAGEDTVPLVPKQAPPSVITASESLASLDLLESHALVVGVSNYQDRSAWPSLPGVQEDVYEVTRALQGQGFHVRVVRDPTKGELVEAMEDFFHTAAQSEASRLLFYYAGHGTTIKTAKGPRGYLVPADAPHPILDPRNFRRAAISMARFQEYSHEATARHMAFLFDSCFSGSIFNVVRSTGLSGSTREKIKEKSRLFVAAGDEDQEVPDKSYFRRAFVEALGGAADLNEDGMIFGIELGQFIADDVTNSFYDTENPQTPRWGRSGDFARGDFPFVVGGNSQ